MKKYTRVLFGFAALVIIAYLIARGSSSNYSASAEIPTEAKQEVVVKKYNEADKIKALEATSDDYFMGNQHAPVVVIEYASLSCPHCAHFHEKVLAPLIPAYIETGKVKYIFRDFPLNKPAFIASKIANCSGKERYFSFIKVLFQSQSNWLLSPDELKKVAKLGGFTDKDFDKCIADKNIEDKILKTQKTAADILGVSSTPTIFINGNLYNAEQSFEAVSAFINRQLKGD